MGVVVDAVGDTCIIAHADSSSPRPDITVAIVEIQVAKASVEVARPAICAACGATCCAACVLCPCPYPPPSPSCFFNSDSPCYLTTAAREGAGLDCEVSCPGCVYSTSFATRSIPEVEPSHHNIRCPDLKPRANTHAVDRCPAPTTSQRDVSSDAARQRASAAIHTYTGERL